MDYIVENTRQDLALQKSLARLVGQGSFAMIARHVGCHPIALIQFSKGNDDALTVDQQTKLSELIIDMQSNRWQGKPRDTGWTVDENGQRVFITGLY